MHICIRQCIDFQIVFISSQNFCFYRIQGRIVEIDATEGQNLEESLHQINDSTDSNVQ